LGSFSGTIIVSSVSSVPEVVVSVDGRWSAGVGWGVDES